MGNIIGTIVSFAIVFFIVTFVHEFGHFFMAKRFGVGVKAFSFGIGPRLFGVRNRRFSIGKADAAGAGTDYRVCLLPVICYVQMEGEGAFEKDRPVPPGDMMAKTRGQRFLIMVMGSAMNLALAVVLMAIVSGIGARAVKYVDDPPVIGWIDAASPAERAGLRADDLIVRVSGREVKTWKDVLVAVGLAPDREIAIEVVRGGERLTAALATGSDKRTDAGYAGFNPRVFTQVRMVQPHTPAERAGLEPGDVVRAIDGRPVYFSQFLEVVRAHPDRELVFTVDRGGRTLDLPVTPRREGDIGRIGIQQEAESVIKKYGFAAAIGNSLRENSYNALLIVRIIKGLFTGETPTSQLGGPLAIADASYAFLREGWVSLLTWIAFLSLQLGVINLIFPIPIVDGPQIVILALEALFRRDVSPKFRIAYTYVGWAMMVALMAFVILNDIVRKLPNGWAGLWPF
ncbi:MAG TPA: RIP metalloprotease RseP [Candidatus Aminicenantes bacterium]|nr:RIP metalloprotease RseP [Candidatus Aminicenantes bacterium]